MYWIFIFLFSQIYFYWGNIGFKYYIFHVYNIIFISIYTMACLPPKKLVFVHYIQLIFFTPLPQFTYLYMYKYVEFLMSWYVGQRHFFWVVDVLLVVLEGERQREYLTSPWCWCHNLLLLFIRLIFNEVHSLYSIVQGNAYVKWKLR